MEAFLAWLVGNLGWEGIKRMLSRGRKGDIALLRQALTDAQNRNRELGEDRALMERLVEQRNILAAKLTEAHRRIAELEDECARLRAAAKKKK